MSCPVVQTSDTQTCLRCRAQWDAGDYEGLCARLRKPVVRVREMAASPGFYEALVTLPIHPNRVKRGHVAPRGRIGIYRSRNRAYDQAMEWLADWFTARKARDLRKFGR